MSNGYTFGEVNWDNADTNTGGGGPRIPFLIMKDPGDYQVRIVSKPFQYYHHWVNDISGAQKKVNCTCDENTCPICKLGTRESKAKPHWLFKIIDRIESAKEGKPVVKVLDCGNQILTAISDLNRDKNWGSVAHYDLTIKRGPKGRNPLYTIHPCPKVALTEDEKNAVRATSQAESVTFIDLSKIGNPWTAEKINSVINGTPGSNIPKAKTGAAATSDSFDDLDELEAPAKTAAAAPAKAVAPQTKPAAPKAAVQSSAQNDEDFLDL